ncbi:MAG: hypothetical protein H6Q71_2792 [Firmicutes bacterium]|jgi:hypothetical protein|nr:hypothetical protein [Bacillota bacterium]
MKPRQPSYIRICIGETVPIPAEARKGLADEE